MQHRLQDGLFLFDEPEAALSPERQMQFAALMDRRVRGVDGADRNGTGGRVQIVMATHSPVLSALPGATILQLSDSGLAPCAWEDLDLVVNERYFLADPQRFLRHLA